MIRLKVEQSGGSMLILGSFGFLSSKPGENTPMRLIKLILVHSACGYRSSSGRSELSTGLKAVHLFFVNDHIRQACHFRGPEKVARAITGSNDEL